MKAGLAGCAVVMALVVGVTGSSRAAPSDYPTEALADYVFGCMATNGETPDALRRCACSIDYIAKKVPYEQYTQAETVLRMRQVPGASPQVSLFKSSPWAQEMIDKVRRAQVEAEARCF